MLRAHCSTLLHQALALASKAQGWPEETDGSLLRLERPKNVAHGDYAVNVSPLSKHLKQLKLSPPQIAQALAEQWPNLASNTGVSVQVLGSFLNFRLEAPALSQALLSLLENPQPGQNTSLSDQRILLEYVSANPTGPLHIGHGRWAVLGSALSNILSHCGAQVTQEFYINDAGSQMMNLAKTLWYRCHEQLKTPNITLPKPVEGQPYPFYPGEYVLELADEFLSDEINVTAVRQTDLTMLESPELASPQHLLTRLKEFAGKRLLEEQKTLLKKLEVHFDVWTSEKATLYDTGKVEAILETLQQKGVTYEQDGALWLKSSHYGDEKDRVLRKSDGSLTYLTADIAYHYQKFTQTLPDQTTPAYNRIINIWGADHHGYIARMQAAIQALGFDVSQFEVLLGQLVNLIVDGEKTRMGKRRRMLTLEDVINEVGVDATRFWMVSKSADTTLDFDVDLATSASNENPVFYAQYAHARCASIVRTATETADAAQQPLLAPKQLADFRAALTPEAFSLLWQVEEQALPALRQLVLRLDSFEELVADAGRLRAPHLIARYTLDLAADFHSFYAVCRVLTPEASTALPRLMLIMALQAVLAQALALLGVSAPERM